MNGIPPPPANLQGVALLQNENAACTFEMLPIGKGTVAIPEELLERFKVSWVELDWEEVSA